MRTLLIILALPLASYAFAQEASDIIKALEENLSYLEYVTPHTEHSTMVSIGHANRLDTYLSPEEYEGTDIRFISSSMRMSHGTWDKQFTHEGAIDYTHNRTENGKALAGHYDFAFSMLKPLDIATNKLTIRAGFMSDIYLGFAYNMHNSSNNPAQGYAALSIGGAAVVTYKPYVFKKTIPITYEIRLPMVGMMFSPAFGQSYYEIFSNGNYDHNIVLTSIAVPQLRHQLTIAYPISKRTHIQIGYLGDYHQSKPNNLKQHIYTSSFIVGYTTGI